VHQQQQAERKVEQLKITVLGPEYTNSSFVPEQ
jgi:hypothetical protein